MIQNREVGSRFLMIGKPVWAVEKSFSEIFPYSFFSLYPFSSSILSECFSNISFREIELKKEFPETSVDRIKAVEEFHETPFHEILSPFR